MFYRRYFCYFPYHRFRSWLIGAGYVYQLVPLRYGSADHYPWSSSDGSLSLYFLEKQKQWISGQKQKNELFSAFLLGLGFSFGWTPCIGPVLGSVLALAASNGQDALMGALYLFIYTLGMAIPFLLLATGIRLCIALFQSSQTPSIVAEENRWSHHHYYGILLLLGRLNSLSSILS